MGNRKGTATPCPYAIDVVGRRVGHDPYDSMDVVRHYHEFVCRQLQIRAQIRAT